MSYSLPARFGLAFAAVFTWFLLSPLACFAKPPVPQVGSRSHDLAFAGSTISGDTLELKTDSKKLTVVCFLGTECPLARLYAGRLNQLASEHKDVGVLGVASNSQDSIKELLHFKTRYQVTFPILKDTHNVIADQYGAVRTPEVFLLNEKLKIVYQGRIDDQYLPGQSRSQPNRRDLKIAIQQYLAGKPITVKKTDPDGCLIGRRKVATDKTPVTFHQHISKILQQHCLECHRQGEIGPMPLSDYDEVTGWAEMILEVIEENRMPPWHADPKHGSFANERRMTRGEKELIKKWVATGTPLGKPSNDKPVTPSPKHLTAQKTTWRLGEPDLVLSMRARPFQVPAQGTVDYQYFVVDPGFKEDKWIIGAEILPGDRSVLHHSIVFVRPPNLEQFRGIGLVSAYVPGQSMPVVDPKYGRKIPAGSRLVFQQHYTPTGKATEDLTRIGFIFGDESKIENEVLTLLAMEQEFLIPPNASNHSVTAKFRWLPKHGSLLGFAPHMHYRGKSFKLTMNHGDKQKTLLKVPHYDFNWQHNYQLSEPIPMSTIESLQFTATFDNSSANKANPDPSQHVSWGDQTSEEMAVAYATIAEPRNRQSSNMTKEKKRNPQEDAEIEKRVGQFVDDYFQRLDKNKDDRISKSEMLRSMKTFGRRTIDLNGDGEFDRQEIKDAANWRFRKR